MRLWELPQVGISGQVRIGFLNFVYGRRPRAGARSEHELLADCTKGGLELKPRI